MRGCGRSVTGEVMECEDGGRVIDCRLRALSISGDLRGGECVSESALLTGGVGLEIWIATCGRC